MAKGIVHLCVGIHDRLETAAGDYADLKRLHDEGLVGAHAAAVVARDAGGTIAVKKRKKDTARGAWTGRGAAPPDEEGGPRGAQRRRPLCQPRPIRERRSWARPRAAPASSGW